METFREQRAEVTELQLGARQFCHGSAWCATVRPSANTTKGGPRVKIVAARRSARTKSAGLGASNAHPNQSAQPVRTNERAESARTAANKVSARIVGAHKSAGTHGASIVAGSVSSDPTPPMAWGRAAFSERACP